MIPRPPKFPEGRRINCKGFAFFGFKPTKVKHVFFISIYVISIGFSFLEMVATQNGQGICATWFLINIFTSGVYLFLKGLKRLINNWNKEL